MDAKMSIEAFFPYAVAVGFGALGWFGRELYAAVNKLKDEVQKLEVKIGTDYVRYDRLQDVMRPVIQKLDEIQTALAHKADK